MSWENADRAVSTKSAYSKLRSQESYQAQWIVAIALTATEGRKAAFCACFTSKYGAKASLLLLSMSNAAWVGCDSSKEI